MVNDWCAFTGLDTTATEISVIEAAFSASSLRLNLVFSDLTMPYHYRAPRPKFGSGHWRDARFSHRQLGMNVLFGPSGGPGGGFTVSRALYSFARVVLHFGAKVRRSLSILYLYYEPYCMHVDVHVSLSLLSHISMSVNCACRRLLACNVTDAGHAQGTRCKTRSALCSLDSAS